MKFTKSFLSVLDNFKNINQIMYFREGKVQSTILVGTNKDSTLVFARANTDVEIETPFAIGNLNKLFSILNVLNEPEVTLNNDSLIISKDNKEAKYKLSNPAFISYEKNPDR